MYLSKKCRKKLSDGGELLYNIQCNYRNGGFFDEKKNCTRIDAGGFPFGGLRKKKRPVRKIRPR